MNGLILILQTLVFRHNLKDLEMAYPSAPSTPSLPSKNVEEKTKEIKLVMVSKFIVKLYATRSNFQKLP